MGKDSEDNDGGAVMYDDTVHVIKVVVMHVY
jgi:hypothetical protein